MYLDYMHAAESGISLSPDDYNDNDGHMYWDTAIAFTEVLASDIRGALNS